MSCKSFYLIHFIPARYQVVTRVSTDQGFLLTSMCEVDSQHSLGYLESINFLY